MLVSIHQNIFCNNSKAIDNLITITKEEEYGSIPRVGENVCNYMWKDQVESKVVDVTFVSNQKCGILLEERIVDFSKEEVRELAKLHRWTTT
ncbi:MAG: hypothetical protein IKN72_01770 [Clostridia bacterium]|nr:hypothetical protein [Clostridia bacterium]